MEKLKNKDDKVDQEKEKMQAVIKMLDIAEIKNIMDQDIK